MHGGQCWSVGQDSGGGNLRKFSSFYLNILSKVKRKVIIWKCERVGGCGRFKERGEGIL